MKTLLRFFGASLALVILGHSDASAQRCKVTAHNLNFNARSSDLTDDTKAALDAIAEEMGDDQCRVVVSGTGGGNKWAEERSWERINKIVDYLVSNHNIDRDRFISRYNGNASRNQVNLRAASDEETGTSREIEPHPELRAR